MSISDRDRKKLDGIIRRLKTAAPRQKHEMLYKLLEGKNAFSTDAAQLMMNLQLTTVTEEDRKIVGEEYDEYLILSRRQ